MKNKSLIETTPELKRRRRRRRIEGRDFGEDIIFHRSLIDDVIKYSLSLAMFDKVLLTLVLISFANNSIIIVTSSSSLSPPFPLQNEHSLFPASPLKHANGFQLYTTNENQNGPPITSVHQQQHTLSSTNSNQSDVTENFSCNDGLLTFELSTGFIYKPSSAETLAMMPSTLQLTDCLDYCLHNSSCLAINFEMGLCVLLSSSAKQNPVNLYSSQFPVFTIYAEKKCLLSGDAQATKQKRRCQRAWTFERVAGYEMKTRPKRKLKLVTKEQCMEACLTERDFECRSANWYRQSGECTLSDQDRHSVSQSEAGDQQIKASLHELYGPSNLTLPNQLVARPSPASISGGLYQNYYLNAAGLQERSRNLTAASTNGDQKFDENLIGDNNGPNKAKRTNKSMDNNSNFTSPTILLSGSRNKYRNIRQLFNNIERNRAKFNSTPLSARQTDEFNPMNQDWSIQQYVDMPANALVDYLENNCVYEPNKLCEFRKIQNRVLKTVDSIYQDISSLDECKQKCLNAPYRCYSFDYGDTSERVCRTSHLDQASLLSVKEPYLDVVGAITYELASCFNVSIQCRAREMVALVSSSKMFKGKIYVKSRPNSCVNDVKESLQFELSMKYHDEACDVRASSTSQQGVFSNDIVIQHHDRIVTTQDVGLSVYCQYDLGNKSITNNVDLAIERIDELPLESKNQAGRPNNGLNGENNEANGSGSSNSPLTITSLATTVVKSPNVTMRITNMNGQPVTSATVGDRLALLFEIKEKTSPFGIFVREIIAMDGRQVQQQLASNNGGRGYHYGQANNNSFSAESSLESIEVNSGNSIQFIDSQGCPTDANIMGPLVKMGPNGHRILAPFDAFKFPTSDMVFFRAVVSSCIAECKPVLCGNFGDQQESFSSSSMTPPTTTPVSFTTKRTTSMAYLTSSTVTPTVRHHHHHHHHGLDSPTNTATTSRRNIVESGAIGRFTTTIPPSAPIQTNRPLIAATPNLDLIYTTLSDMSDLSLPLTKQTNNLDQELSSSPPSSSSGASSSSTTAPTSINHSGGQQQQQHQIWDQNPLDLGQSSSNISITTVNHKPPKQSLDGQNTTNQVIAGDSLTTVPGFAQQQQQTNAPTAVSDANNQQQLVVNMTNNHQLGKAPPRPSTIPPSMGDKTIGPPIDLNKLTQEQKEQLVKLFESKLKQPSERNNNGSISEMADFYTGFLTSIMMNGIEGSDSNLAERKQQQQPQQEKLGEQQQKVASTSGQQTVENNYLRNEKLAQILSEYKPESINRDINIRPAELDSLLSPYILRLRLNKTIELVAAEITRLLRRQAALTLANSRDNQHEQQQQQQQEVANLQSLIKPIQSDIFHSVTNNMSGMNNNLMKQNNSNYYDDLASQASTLNATPVFSSPQLTASQQSSDSNKALTKSPSPSSNRLKTRSQPVGINANSNKATTSSTLQGANKMASVATKVSGQQEAGNEINATATAAASAQLLAKQQAKKANLQALADSYLGAYQPLLGRRRNKRRRRRRSIEETEGSTLFPGYVYLEQAQGATLAPSLSRYNNAEARFTQGVVEMYYTASNSRGQVHTTPKQRLLTKRDVQPFYDIDELVVQSIKIVDRLQFPDEDQPNSSDDHRIKSSHSNGNAASGNKFEHRSQPAKSNLTSADSHHYPKDVSDSASLHDFDDERGEMDEGGSQKLRLISLSGSGAISLLIVTLSFVFVQIFLIVICLMDWNWHKMSAKRKNLARSSQDLTSIDYSSTISNIGCKPGILSRSDSTSSLSICTTDVYARSGTFGSSHSSSIDQNSYSTYNTSMNKYNSTQRRFIDTRSAKQTNLLVPFNRSQLKQELINKIIESNDRLYYPNHTIKHNSVATDLRNARCSGPTRCTTCSSLPKINKIYNDSRK